MKIQETWLHLLEDLVEGFHESYYRVGLSRSAPAHPVSGGSRAGHRDPSPSGVVAGESLQDQSRGHAKQTGREWHHQRIKILLQSMVDLISKSEMNVEQFPVQDMIQVARCCLKPEFVSKCGVAGSNANNGLQLIPYGITVLSCLTNVIKSHMMPEVAGFAARILKLVENSSSSVSSLPLTADRNDMYHLMSCLYQGLDDLILDFGPATEIHSSACDRLLPVVQKLLLDKRVEVPVETETLTPGKQQHYPGMKRRKMSTEPSYKEETQQGFEAQIQAYIKCCRFLKSLVTCLGPILKRGFYLDLQRVVCEEVLKLSVVENGLRLDCKLGLLELFRSFLTNSVPGVPPPVHVGATLVAELQTDFQREIRSASWEISSILGNICRPQIPILECRTEPLEPPDVEKSQQVLSAPVLTEEAIRRQILFQESKEGTSADDVITHVINIDEESSSESGSDSEKEHSQDSSSSTRQCLEPKKVVDVPEAIEEEDLPEEDPFLPEHEMEEEPEIICVEPDSPERTIPGRPLDTPEKNTDKNNGPIDSVEKMLGDFVAE